MIMRHAPDQPVKRAVDNAAVAGVPGTDRARTGRQLADHLIDQQQHQPGQDQHRRRPAAPTARCAARQRRPGGSRRSSAPAGPCWIRSVRWWPVPAAVDRPPGRSIGIAADCGGWARVTGGRVLMTARGGVPAGADAGRPGCRRRYGHRRGAGRAADPARSRLDGLGQRRAVREAGRRVLDQHLHDQRGDRRRDVRRQRAAARPARAPAPSPPRSRSGTAASPARHS